MLLSVNSHDLYSMTTMQGVRYKGYHAAYITKRTTNRGGTNHGGTNRGGTNNGGTNRGGTNRGGTDQRSSRQRSVATSRG